MNRYNLIMMEYSVVKENIEGTNKDIFVKIGGYPIWRQ